MRQQFTLRILSKRARFSFGTGTNGAYVEDVAKITKLCNSDAAAQGGQMVVNTEWGAFDNRVSVNLFGRHLW